MSQNSLSTNQPQRSKRVLVVEDAPDLKDVIQVALQFEGYDVRCAINGQEALDYLNGPEPLPDLILLDLMMPVMDGFEFRHRQLLDANIRSIPVVIMTAGGDNKDKFKVLAANAFIKKPTDLDHLFEVIRTHIH